MTSGWKDLAERALTESGLPWLVRRLRRDEAVVLAYHNVIPDDYPSAGDGSLHLAESTFRMQLDLLGETHDIVPLDALENNATAGERPRAVLTFDDAYRGTLELALPAILERDLSATVFVAPGLLDEQAFWWDQLADSGSASLDPAVRQHAIGSLQGRQELVLEWAGRVESAPSLPALMRPASRRDVLAAALRPGIRLGSHSWSHPSLPAVDDDARRAELTESREWLEANAPEAITRWLAYPYGHHDSATRDSAEEAGYSGAVTGSGCWTNTPVHDRFAVPRINVPSGLSMRGFRLRTAGILIP